MRSYLYVGYQNLVQHLKFNCLVHFCCVSVFFSRSNSCFTTQNEDDGHLNIQDIVQSFSCKTLMIQIILNLCVCVFVGGGGGELYMAIYQKLFLYNLYTRIPGKVAIHGFVKPYSHNVGFVVLVKWGTSESTPHPWLSPSLRRIANRRLQRHLKTWKLAKI